MSATIRELGVDYRHPAHLNGVVLQHVCGSTHFNLLSTGEIYCAKCNERMISVRVEDAQQEARA